MNLKINNLFGKYTYDIEFNNNLNVIVGENGCGKSTIINIIYNLSKKNFDYLSNIEFEYISLSSGEYKIELIRDHIIQMDISTNPAFRYNLSKINIDKFNNFDEFFNYVINYNLPKYHYKMNNYTKVNEYLNDDKYYYSDEFINYMAKYKLNYGSRLYLLCYYSFFKNYNPFSDLEKIVNDVLVYSFVDIKDIDKFRFEKNSEQSTLCRSILHKYFKDKEIIFDDYNIIIHDIQTRDQIDESNLSSGERKIIKIIQLIITVKENEFLLLDEPELSLSIYWQRYMIEDILKYCKAKRIIIATQSPNLLNINELDFLIPIYSDGCVVNE